MCSKYGIFLVILQQNIVYLEMAQITIKDKTFKTSIPEAEILKRFQLVSFRIILVIKDLNPILLSVLNGSFFFFAWFFDDVFGWVSLVDVIGMLTLEDRS